MTLNPIKIAAALVCISHLDSNPARSQELAPMVLSKELLNWCADGSPTGSAACTAFIMGVADSVTDPRFLSCPGNVARGEIRAAVMPHLLALQATGLDIPAAAVVTTALQKAFPCGKK